MDLSQQSRCKHDLILLPLLITLANTIQKVPASLNNNLMILLLLQSADDDDSNHTLDTLNSDRETSTVDSKLLSLVQQTILFGKGLFVSLELVVHVPSAAAKAQNGSTLSVHPRSVVGGDAAADGCVEERSAVG